MNFKQRRMTCAIFGVALLAQCQPSALVFPPIAPDDEPPPIYTLGWTQPSPPPVVAWLVRTNGVFVGRALTNSLSITNPVGCWITNSVVAEGTNGLLSLPSSLIWSNVFWQKPMTNILTFRARSSTTRPASLNSGNEVAQWRPVILTNPPAPGVNLFWIPMRGTNAQAIECRTGAITNNLFLDGLAFTNWPAFIGQGFYWVTLSVTNI